MPQCWCFSHCWTLVTLLVWESADVMSFCLSGTLYKLQLSSAVCSLKFTVDFWSTISIRPSAGSMDFLRLQACYFSVMLVRVSAAFGHMNNNHWLTLWHLQSIVCPVRVQPPVLGGIKQPSSEWRGWGKQPCGCMLHDNKETCLITWH